MPRPITWTFRVGAEGDLPPNALPLITEQARLYADNYVRVKVSAPTRSLKQNSYLHAALADIQTQLRDAGVTRFDVVLDTGVTAELPITVESLKALMKAQYGPRDDDGEIRSTASYDTTEMHDFVESIRLDEWLIGQGVYVKTPEEYTGG